MKLNLITVNASFANAARRAQLSDAIAVTKHEPTQTPDNQLKGDAHLGFKSSRKPQRSNRESRQAGP